jgi:hypothetical protein
MEKAAIKDITYGGLLELMNNPRYYYNSRVGQDYSHWTDLGKDALVEYMNSVAYKMIQAEEADLDKRAKNMVMGALKGSPNDKNNR